MWCPKCASEYRKGFTVCADCGSPLVEALPDKPALDPAFLAKTVGDGAWELPELLHRMGIPCYLYGGNGLFIRMEPEQAVPGELYVDRRHLDLAKSCCNLLAGAPQPIAPEELMQAYEESADAFTEAEEPAAGGAAWKVFLGLGLLMLGFLLILSVRSLIYG